MPRPEKPKGLNAPGLSWRPRSNGYVAYWVARPDLVKKRGYSLKSVRLWPPSNSLRVEPQADEWLAIGSNCVRLQGEMLEWANAGPANWDPRSLFDDTLASLIQVYQKDPDSPFRNLRQRTAQGYVSQMTTLIATVGTARISGLTFRDFKRWHENFCKPAKDGGPVRRARGHGLMTMVRIALAFGKLLRLPGCKEASETIGAMEFAVPKRREEFMTAAWDTAVRQKANEMGYHSIALAQALMYGLGIRQKDALGEWVRDSEPGIAEVAYHGEKWLFGMSWQNASGLVITHRLSKSIRGRDGILDLNAGKVKSFDLRLYPMVMEELARVHDRTGPLVKEERTGRPWKQKTFAATWRRIARAAGVPDNVQNRDSRAGAATEIERVAGLENTRKAMGHSKQETSRIYTRDEDTATASAAILRFENKPKTP